MIFFVVRRFHEYTVTNFMQSWGRSLLGRAIVLTWDDLPYVTRLHRGAYVFTDFERLSPDQLALGRAVAGQLAAAGCRILNAPHRVAGRLELLQRLHSAGINRFRAFEATAATSDLSAVRFPCFVRRTSAHMGDVSGLLHDRAALDAELTRRRTAGEDDLIVIEYLDVSAPRFGAASPGADTPGDRVFRKYGVFRCGDAMAARHIYLSREWVQNKVDIVDDALVAEEAAFVDANPHERQLRRVFDVAGLDYGRVDYGVLDGQVQVWEINTNPMLMAAPHRLDPRRLPAQARGAAATTTAIAAIDDGGALQTHDGPHWIPIDLDPDLRARLGVNRIDDALRYFGRALGRIGSAPLMRRFVQACQRARWLAER